jgi:hypothetical protein
MKASRALALLATSIFLLSYFLPAYGNGSGFACFGACWETITAHDAEILSGAWLYYSGFVIENILFIALAVALLVMSKSRMLRSILSVVFFLHVLSWFAVHLFQRPPELSEIKIGYYVWLIAFGLLAAAHFWKPQVRSLEPVSIPV